MMTLGTVGAFGFADFHPPEILELFANAGCTRVQIFRNREKHFTPEEIAAVCKDAGLTVDSLHAHFGDDLDPSSEDEAIRRATVEAYRPEAEYCRAIGGNLIVVHPSPGQAPAASSTRTASLPPKTLDRRYEQLRRSLVEFARIGEETGVTMAFENMPPYHPVGADVGRLVRTIADTGSEHVIFLLDFGHAHMTCGIGAAITAAATHLRSTHVHDNDGVHDTHALPFRGTLPWDECARALHQVGYDGVFMLEVFEKADELRRCLTEDWKRNVSAILNGR